MSPKIAFEGPEGSITDILDHETLMADSGPISVLLTAWGLECDWRNGPTVRVYGWPAPRIPVPFSQLVIPLLSFGTIS